MAVEKKQTTRSEKDACAELESNGGHVSFEKKEM